MKLIKRHSLLITLGLFVVVTLTLNLSKTFAQDRNLSLLDTQFSDLLTKMDAMTDSINTLATQGETHQDQSVGGFAEEQEMMAFMDGSPTSRRCMADAHLWPSSNTYQENPWETHFIETNYFGQFTDINGDGLVDYIYAEENAGYRAGCTMLNNGQGWEPVYQCTMVNLGGGTWEFRGDCAQV